MMTSRVQNLYLNIKTNVGYTKYDEIEETSNMPMILRFLSNKILVRRNIKLPALAN